MKAVVLANLPLEEVAGEVAGDDLEAQPWGWEKDLGASLSKVPGGPIATHDEGLVHGISQFVCCRLMIVLISQIQCYTMRLLFAVLATLLVISAASLAVFARTPTKLPVLLPASSNSTSRQLELTEWCIQPDNAAYKWHYNDMRSEPVVCIGVAPNAFAMLSAYVHGGTEDVDWKYTNDPKDPDCLVGWTYYEKDKETVRQYVSGTLSLNPKKSKKTWCPLRVYKPGGIRRKQWDFCSCAVYKPHPTHRAAADGCSVPIKTVRNWSYNGREGPYNCTNKHEKSGKKWTMLNAFRADGENGQGRYWKYTNDPYDPDCLSDWSYYKSDGVTKIADIGGSLTTLGRKKSWCALPVYRTNGKLGYQWDYCICP